MEEIASSVCQDDVYTSLFSPSPHLAVFLSLFMQLPQKIPQCSQWILLKITHL